MATVKIKLFLCEVNYLLKFQNIAFLTLIFNDLRFTIQVQNHFSRLEKSAS